MTASVRRPKGRGGAGSPPLNPPLCKKIIRLQCPAVRQHRIKSDKLTYIYYLRSTELASTYETLQSQYFVVECERPIVDDAFECRIVSDHRKHVFKPHGIHLHRSNRNPTANYASAILNSVQRNLKQNYTTVGHGLDPSMDWIGLDWVRILRKLSGLDWIVSDDCNPLFYSFIYFLY